MADLPDDVLGLAGSSRIQLDRDAAGGGWFIDPTPYADEEAFEGFDLLTTLLHELATCWDWITTTS